MQKAFWENGGIRNLLRVESKQPFPITEGHSQYTLGFDVAFGGVEVAWCEGATMNEVEWRACSDPIPMLEFLRGKASERKLRLFACASCRRAWGLLRDVRSKQAIEVSERYADGLAGEEELSFVMDIALAAQEALWDEFRTNASLGREEEYKAVSEMEAAFAVWRTCSPRQALFFVPYPSNGAIGFAPRQVAYAVGGGGGVASETAVQSSFLRDIFGTLLFRSFSLDPAWLAWENRTLSQMAQSIYDDRAFDSLPILADALEEAGCDNAEILNHCRQPGEHVRGCWLVDLILGKK